MLSLITTRFHQMRTNNTCFRFQIAFVKSDLGYMAILPIKLCGEQIQSVDHCHHGNNQNTCCSRSSVKIRQQIHTLGLEKEDVMYAICYVCKLAPLKNEEP